MLIGDFMHIYSIAAISVLLALKVLITTAADDILIFFIENKA